jgi:ribonuclease HII
MSKLFENDLAWLQKKGPFAGLDEAGRGALAGPVVVAAVVLDYNRPITGLNDSKLLSPAARESLFDQIKSSALAFNIVRISQGYIDRFNILQATLLGFSNAFQKLEPAVQSCLIDGNHLPPDLKHCATAVIKGDSLHAAIAAASILAKVSRDKLMTEYDAVYPEYGFADHKGYGTPHHIRMIHSFGLCPIHRKSFRIPDLP